MKTCSVLALVVVLATPMATAAQVSQTPVGQTTVPTAPATQALPVFDFLGQNTETVSTMTALNGSACTVAGAETDCTDYSDPIIAGRHLNWLWMKYYNGKLYSVCGSFGRYAFGELLSAFTAKYGTPTIETRKWQSKGGATFDNSVAIWKFKGGTLELASMGTKIDNGDFTFLSSENAPPAPSPKIDF